MTKHQHKWEWKERGIGRYQKGNREVFYTPGHKAVCSCAMTLFFPDNPKLRPVEIDPEEVTVIYGRTFNHRDGMSELKRFEEENPI